MCSRLQTLVHEPVRVPVFRIKQDCSVSSFSWGRRAETSFARCDLVAMVLLFWPFCCVSSSSTTSAFKCPACCSRMREHFLLNSHLSIWKGHFWKPNMIGRMFVLDAGRWGEAGASTAWACSICRCSWWGYDCQRQLVFCRRDLFWAADIALWLFMAGEVWWRRRWTFSGCWTSWKWKDGGLSYIAGRI